MKPVFTDLRGVLRLSNRGVGGLVQLSQQIRLCASPRAWTASAILLFAGTFGSAGGAERSAGSTPISADRLAKISTDALTNGWLPQVVELRRHARSELERGDHRAAAQWFDVYRWAKLLGQTETTFTSTWVNEVSRASVVHDGMAATYQSRNVPLGASLSAESQAWFIQHPTFSAEFFALIRPVDYLPKVLGILDELYRHDPKRFETYSRLALAIAVVYDVPPPSDWPHAQVSTTVLRRQWLDPRAVFDWLINRDAAKRSVDSLVRLSAEELKHVVDLAVPLLDLEWAEHKVMMPTSELEQAYRLVKYDVERSSRNGAMWERPDYRLSTILGTGGICVDQAFFASQVGKGRAVPTLFFHGAGDGGRHAWFGFLDRDHVWQLNGGRYAEQRFVTGFTRDPQTWVAISDHELAFLRERFRSSPGFKESKIWADFASDALASGEADAACVFARNAVRRERKNLQGWEVLFAGELSMGKPAKQREATLHEAMMALAQYPDLEMKFSQRISESLRGRGQTSAADFERRRIAKKYELGRGDLILRQAREDLWAGSAGHVTPALVKNYDATVDRLGPGAGIAFFDEIVTPFVEFLMVQNRPLEAQRSLERARRTLRVEPASQLAEEFRALEAQIAASN